MNNFDSLVVNKQYAYSSLEKPLKISFALTPTGSYFDNVEFPQELRLDMLEQLHLLSHHYDVPFTLYIECHCKDANALDLSSSATIKELQLLRALNAHILFGFESANDYVRNVLYNKNLEIEEFLHACNIAKNAGLQVGAFIFAGLFILIVERLVENIENLFRGSVYDLAQFSEQDFVDEYLCEYYAEAYDENLDYYVDKTMSAASNAFVELAEDAKEEADMLLEQIEELETLAKKVLKLFKALPLNDIKIDNTKK